MQASQIGVAAVAGAINPATATEAGKPSIASHLEEAARVAASMRVFNERLSRLCDRILGPRPEGDWIKELPEAHGFDAHLGNVVSLARMNVDRSHELLNALETFA